MRFSMWKKAVTLCVAALGSGGVLASSIVERAPAASSRAQAPSRASVKRIGTAQPADPVQTKADAQVPAVPSAESAPASHAPAEGRVLTLPHKQEETAPGGSGVLPVALRVRG